MSSTPADCIARYYTTIERPAHYLAWLGIWFLSTPLTPLIDAPNPDNRGAGSIGIAFYY